MSLRRPASAQTILSSARKPGGRSSRRALWLGLAFASPFIIGFLFLFAYPIAASAFYSFTDFNLFQTPRWVGLDNYSQMFGNPTFWQSLGNTLYLTVIGVPLAIIISLAGAHLLNFPVKGQPLYRALVYLPSIVPIVVGGYLWRWLLNTQYGFLNYFLGLFGIDGPAWLQELDWTKPAILLMTFWTVGGTTIIYLAALKDVPQELYEAAEIDGANSWRKFLNVTVPLISPVIFFNLIMGIISALKSFDLFFIMTEGGPNNTTLTFMLYLYRLSFESLRMGYGSAMAWLLFVYLIVLTAIVFKSSSKWVYYESTVKK